MTAFEEFGVMPELGQAVEDMEWNLPTDVQAEAIPLVLGGGDVLMAAETGSGKTGAFCLPVLQVTWESLKDLQEGRGRGGGQAKPRVPSSWGMSVFDRGAALAVSGDGLRCQSREQKEWHGARAVRGVQGGGRYYYEATVTDEGLCRVGIATGDANLDLGTCKDGFGYGGTGKKSNNRQFDSYGGSYGKADVIGLYLDLDQLEIWYSKNGADLGQAFAISPALRNKVFYPAVVLKNAEMLFNFGDTPFKYVPLEGYVAFKDAPAARLVENLQGAAGGAVTERKKINNAPQAIIIEPSRELAEQTFNQLRLFQVHLPPPGVSTLLVVGGEPARNQIAALRAGVDIVVATPGRLEDLVTTKELCLSQCRFFVLDEADGLLKAGYEPFISRLHGQVPRVTSDGRRLQMIVCSATLHAVEVKRLAERLMYFPTWVDLKGQDAVPECVHHVVVRVDPVKDQAWRSYSRPAATDGVHARDRRGGQDKESLSEGVKLMKAEYCIRAIDEHKMDYGLLFCRTKVDCDNLEQFLNTRGGGRGSNQAYSCTVLHGDRKPQERKANLEMFKRMEVKFLICTDVAARGIDITGLPFVINVTLPDEKSNYVHRIGRVGRAERMGLAISLVSVVQEKVWYHGNWCPSKGKACSNTQLTEVRGCCVWYDEPLYLAAIEEHLGVTIQQAGPDCKVKADEFDGKVVYGEKKAEQGPGYAGHQSQLAPTLAALTKLETEAQDLFLRRMVSQAVK